MSSKKRPIVLLFSDYYLPGYKSGGGMRTIVNMVDRLSHKYDFRIVTRDHDGVEDKEPYKDVAIDEWNEIGDAKVFYLSKSNIRMKTLRKIIHSINPTIIYTNSCFSTLAIYVLKLRKLGLLEGCPFVIAPCGELSTGALRLKRSKKKIFLNYAKLIKLYSNIIWKASTKLEAEEVERLNPKAPTVMIAPDLPTESIFKEFRIENKPAKNPGELRLVFLSRFHKKKNLNWLFPHLKEVEGRIRLDIVGPIQDWDYFRETKQLIEGMPGRFEINVVGPVPHEEVCRTLAEYHFFVCPTLGENFGHVFLESMAAGTPLILSDQTPWIDLEEKRIGWAIPLDRPESWKTVLAKCVAMENAEFLDMARASREYVTNWLASSELDAETENVLDFAVESAAKHAAAL